MCTWRFICLSILYIDISCKIFVKNSMNNDHEYIMLEFLIYSCICFRIPTISSNDLGRKLRLDRSMYFVFAVNNTDKQLLANVNEIAKEFQSTGNFFFYDKQSALRALEYNRVDSPALFYFNASLFIAAAKLPKEKEQLRTLMTQLVTDHADVVHSVDTFNSLIGDFKYTLVANEGNFGTAKFMFFEMCKRFGDTQILVVSDDILAFYNIHAHKDAHVLYRREDEAFEYFDKTNISNVVIPKVRVFNEEDAGKESKVMVILTGTSFTGELKNQLLKLHRKFPDFVYGYMNYNLMEKLGKLNGMVVTQQSSAFVCNFRDRYYYTPSGVDICQIESIIEEILAGKIERQYLSEPEKSVLEARVGRIVGKTYQKFISQDRDVLMLFTDGSECEMQAVFEDFANEFSDIDVSFGVIDVSKNSERFPPFYELPQVILFPKNKTDYQHLRGSQTRDNIMLLLEHYGSSDTWPFAGKIPSRAEFESEIQKMSNTVNTLPPSDKSKHFKWMFRMSKLIDAQAPRDEL